MKNALRYFLCAALVAFTLVSLPGEVYAQDVDTQVGTAIDTFTTTIAGENGIANTAVTATSNMLIQVVKYSLILLVIGAGVGFVWKFFTGSRARC